MNRKSGITVSSLVIYVVLFFVFTFFVTTITANVNKTMFIERGKINNIKNVSKLNSYLVGSSKKSSDVYLVDKNIVFDNNDEYKYDSAKQTLYKNDKVLLKGVTKFIPGVERVASNVKEVSIEIEIEKYMVTKKETMRFAVREGV